MNEAGFSRRDFVKIAGLGSAALALPQHALSAALASSKAQPMTLDACQSMSCLGIAENSPMVQKSWLLIQKEAAELKDNAIRQLVQNILNNPLPSLAQQMDANNRHEVWKELSSRAYTTQSEKDFLPPLADSAKAYTFFAAPGSGYQSHHAYPGGLATHVATNIAISRSIINTYRNVYGYAVNSDVAMAAQLLHDIHKPYVFQWQADATCRAEQVLAKTGEHHVLSVAELIVRKAPAALVVAQACAHTHPGTEADEALVVDWLKAAAIIAGVNPVEQGLLESGGKTLPLPRRQEGFICHLADHDFVLSVPAVKWTLPLLQEIAVLDYHISENDLKGKPFNSLRNVVYAHFSAMQVQEVMVREGREGVRRLIHAVVQTPKA